MSLRETINTHKIQICFEYCLEINVVNEIKSRHSKVVPVTKPWAKTDVATTTVDLKLQLNHD